VFFLCPTSKDALVLGRKVGFTQRIGHAKLIVNICCAAEKESLESCRGKSCIGTIKEGFSSVK